MSGGFFRGTSADQDTRFSNKQAKLLKTQKFAPELDHLVDMTKVKMDVMKPWIATRVTELLGFEDEVLINFIYGLLDEKEVDGKKIQIQLTGFMEKNTVKFMKELWSLLLSAQQNASGVPQQFLDAKEAEIQQKKAEEARIAQEIQKKREKDGRDTELEKHKMDGDTGNSRFHDDPFGSASNIPSADAEKDKELNSKHSSRTKSREGRRSMSVSLSPRGRRQSISPRRHSPSPSRPSFSSDRQQRSSRRSISPRRSVSPQRHSPRNTSLVSRQRSSYSRRRSLSDPKYRSPSPRRRSPIRRKSSSSGRRTSPSPHHRRSPARALRRSPSPARRRSPARHKFSPARHWSPSPGRRRPRSPSPGRRRPRSPSPGRRRPRSPSPGRRRPRSPSPGRRRPRSPSPGRRRPRSPSPGRRRPRSPSPGRRRPRSPSPGRRRPRSRSPGRQRSHSPHRSPQLRSPKRRRRSPISPKTRSANLRVSSHRRRSISPYSSRSPNRTHRSLSRDTDKGTNGVSSIKDRDMVQRSQDRRSYNDERHDTEMSGHRSPDSEEHRLTESLRTPNSAARNSTHDSPLKSAGKHLPGQDNTDTSGDEEEGSRARENARKANSSRRKTKDFSVDMQLQKVHADDSGPGEKSPSRSPQSAKDIQKKHDNELLKSSEDERDGTRISSDDSRWKLQSPSRVGKDNSYSKDGMDNEHVMRGSRDASHVAISAKKYSGKVEDSQLEDGSRLKKANRIRTHGNSHIDSGSSGSEESEKRISHSEKRRHMKSRKHKRHYDDSSESDSEPDDKESKRRRKEEKKMRKEERRLRREERHRKRADRHASKQKMKHVDSFTLPSDPDKDRESDSDVDLRKKGSYTEREESDQKKLEIELREKALESLRAKKSHQTLG